MKKKIFLIISILLLIAAIGTFGYLYYENNKIEKEINESKENIKKVEETIKDDEKELTEKEDEYEKLKEKVKDSLEELNIWVELKEELNKSLS
jgi:predicted negative regulator of RcsB-dependent stress response